MRVPDQPIWVPISQLPLDCLGDLQDPKRVLELRVHSESKPWAAPPWLTITGWLLVALTVLLCLAWPEAFFGLFPGLPLILLSAAFVPAWILWHRLRHYHAEGGQTWLIGHASLVAIDASAVQVFPAEKIELKHNAVYFHPEGYTASTTGDTGQVLDLGYHSNPWLEALRQAIAEARKGPDSQSKDSFRLAAAQSPPNLELRGLRAKAREPMLYGTALSLLAGLWLFSGPLHTRALEAQQREARNQNPEPSPADPNLDATSQSPSPYGRAYGYGTLGGSSNTSRRNTLTNMARQALLGTADDCRMFLRQTDSESMLPTEYSTVFSRLATLCSSVYPIPDNLREKDRVLRMVLRKACVSPEATLYYSTEPQHPELFRAAEFIAQQATRLALSLAYPMSLHVSRQEGSGDVLSALHPTAASLEPELRAFLQLSPGPALRGAAARNGSLSFTATMLHPSTLEAFPRARWTDTMPPSATSDLER